MKARGASTAAPAPLPADEARRLARLRALLVLDSAPEPLFDSLARLAAQIAETPIALVSLVDAERQWFKANIGLTGTRETPRDVAFCAHAIEGDGVMEVSDARADPRFATNPLVTGNPGIRFYAGAPLLLPGGERVGTLCVIDRTPRHLTAAQRAQLAELAQTTVQSLLLRERALSQAPGAQGTAGAVESELAGHVRALSSILDRLPMSVTVWDRQLRNAYANVPAQQRVNLSAATLQGMHLIDLIGKKTFDAYREQRAAVLSGQWLSFDARVERANGMRDEHIHLVPLHGDSGQVEGYVALVQDLWDERSRSAAQRALTASERKFRTLSDASPLGVFHADANGHCTYTNARWRSIFGLGSQDSLGEGWLRALHPDDRANVTAAWQRAAASGREFAMEFRVQWPDGNERLVRSLARSLEGDDGAIAGFVGTVEDVTEAREAERQLRDSEDFLDRTGQVAGVGGWDLSLIDGTMTWSDQTCRIHDLDPGHRPGFAEAMSFYEPDARAQVARAIEHAIADSATLDLELPLTTARGRSIWVRLVGEVAYANGLPRRVFGAIQDVTWRHDAERALRDSNRLLTQLYQQTPAMMHSIDIDGRLLSVSDRWLQTMGYTREEVIGRPALSFFTDASREQRRRDLQELWRNGRHTSGVLQVLRCDGRALDIVASAIVQYDDDGRALRSLVVTDDVTELLARTAELRREQVQRADVERHAAELDALLAERSEMLNVLAHEVRQPLNNASAALQSATAALADPRSRDEAAERLRRAQGVMHTVMSGVDNTLAVAALVGGTTPSAAVDADADIDTLLEVAIGDMPLADRERVRIQRLTPTRTASMDVGLLRLALRNLLANALRHSPRDSPVILRVSDSDEPLALVIDVVDQGWGIQAEVLPRLFERGTRGRDPSGRASHGLGLYIVRRALEMQGGRAELVATGQGGTTMRLWIAQAGAALPAQAGTSGARNQ